MRMRLGDPPTGPDLALVVYLTSFSEAAASAAAAAVADEAGRYVGFRQCGRHHRPSQAMARPDCHGTKVTPSGRLTLSQ